MQFYTFTIFNIFFILMTFDGVRRGWEYGSIDEHELKIMIVETVANPSGRLWFPTFQANGYLLIDRRKIDVPIFKRQYKSLRKGDRLIVFELPKRRGTFITQSKIEESKPIPRFAAISKRLALKAK